MGDTEEVRRARLLVVDDDPLVLSSLRRLLASPLATVQCASGPQAALDWVSSGGKPWVVVSDQSMPGMSGFALLNELRRRLPSLFGILHTGDVRLSMPVSDGLVVTIVAKPAEPAALRELVLTVLRGRATAFTGQ